MQNMLRKISLQKMDLPLFQYGQPHFLTPKQMNPPSANFFTACFFILVAGAGFWLSKFGRYPIFFFLLCLSGVLNYLLYLAANKILEYDGHPVVYSVNGNMINQPFLFANGLQEYVYKTSAGLIILLFFISIANLCMPKMKRSVKIVSVLILLLNIAGVVAFIYAIAHMGKIGG